MVDAARARKLADRIQQIVAEMLERRIKDPRLGFVTVTDTRITNDLRDATVYYTVYGSDGERAETAAALESAKGVIRSEVGRKTGVRHTPSITFVMDSLMENAAHIDDLLAKARARDAEVARAAQNASPAGDPNPYRTSGSDDEDLDEDDEDDESEDEESEDDFDGHDVAGDGEDSRPGRPSS
ncbi:ribosome-binding factor A [Actinomadura hallensis]|uniref:Ribosome-binding factor A n=1 Tax=Actinomadura hallensis TaxID=337895 RepID=A0A543IIK7_9ACTN|nr:30S ribosome-binding factor RbfA [Actinomadura hallensis]TQM70397.1 ribosome-binding factor A [Actinomadura hallensis]HLV73225.1 30S ribosome-binding factor RbfA [Vulgatibacteraceae bacterium]